MLTPGPGRRNLASLFSHSKIITGQEAATEQKITHINIQTPQHPPGVTVEFSGGVQALTRKCRGRTVHTCSPGDVTEEERQTPHADSQPRQLRRFETTDSDIHLSRTLAQDGNG
ncbi:hypothetical protein JOB18_008797 [Solea senegalensis]|uniref:Uncharacterized protein n=1 Tax=Solea senegalensis TaxID=28829 RepID=A0AAV6T4E0_SOLSE|nr:hypothetical protein JOB18_008797 [Solea senegalensis]